MSHFHGIWISLITPFADGRVDHPAPRQLVNRYAAAGVTGFVALGTTGEPSSLDEAEQQAVLSTILDAAGPLISPTPAVIPSSSTIFPIAPACDWI